MIPRIEVLREDDPRCAELKSRGYSIVGESWGARLRLDSQQDFEVFQEAIDRVARQGAEIREIRSDFTDALLELELATNVDYPASPATTREIPTRATMNALLRSDSKTFGAIWNQALIGVLSTSEVDRVVELDFFSVLPGYRNRGVAKGLGAAAISAWAALGMLTFACGGAAENAASLALVNTLGFAVEERWFAFEQRL